MIQEEERADYCFKKTLELLNLGESVLGTGKMKYESCTTERQKDRKTERQKDRNLLVDLWRFLLSILIIIYHYLKHNFGINTGWYIGVEFFFILSGFLLYMHIDKYGIEYEIAWRIIWEKAVKFWPVYLCGFFSVLISTCFFRDHLKWKDFLQKLFHSIPEIFYLDWQINGVGWYISTLLTVSLLLLFLLSINKKAAVFCIFPLGIYYIYWELYSKLPSIQSFTTFTFSNLIRDCYFRAGAGVALGMIGGVLFCALQENCSRISHIAHQWGNRCGCIGIVFALFLIKRFPKGLTEYICIALFFFSVIGLFIGTDIAPKLERFRKKIEYLGVISFTLYIQQYIFDWIKFSESIWVSVVIIVSINLIYGFCTYEGIRRLRQL